MPLIGWEIELLTSAASSAGKGVEGEGEEGEEAEAAQRCEVMEFHEPSGCHLLSYILHGKGLHGKGSGGGGGGSEGGGGRGGGRGEEEEEEQEEERALRYTDLRFCMWHPTGRIYRPPPSPAKPRPPPAHRGVVGVDCGPNGGQLPSTEPIDTLVQYVCKHGGAPSSLQGDVLPARAPFLPTPSHPPHAPTSSPRFPAAPPPSRCPHFLVPPLPGGRGPLSFRLDRAQVLAWRLRWRAQGGLGQPLPRLRRPTGSQVPEYEGGGAGAGAGYGGEA